MKICLHCKQNKSMDSFGINKQKSDGHNIYCKNCRQEMEKQRYSIEKEKIRNNIYKFKKERRKILHENIKKYLLNHPCVDCGEDDIIVLEFDHLKDKEFEISLAINLSYSLEKVLKEISKCEVVCCNCHRRRTSKKIKSWRVSV